MLLAICRQVTKQHAPYGSVLANPAPIGTAIQIKKPLHPGLLSIHAHWYLLPFRINPSLLYQSKNKKW
jgi:hypothetical protein